MEGDWVVDTAGNTLVGEFLVVGDYSTCLAIGAEVLSWLKAEAAGI